MNLEHLYRVLRFLVVIIGIYLSVYLLLIIAKYTYPFIIGFSFAYLLKPFVTFLTNKLKIPKSLSVILSMLVTVALIAGLITFLVAEMVAGITYLSEALPEHLNTMVVYTQNYITNHFIPFYEKIISFFNTLDTGQQDTILSNIEQLGKEAGNTIVSILQSFLAFLPVVIGWLPSVGTGAIFTLLATFFIAKEWDRFINYSKKMLPNKTMYNLKNVMKELEKALFGFIRAQLTLISITALIVLVGLLILRVDYAITIALIIGFVDLLPYLGTGLVFVPWIIYELIIGNFGFALGLGILYTVVIVQRQFMEPKILSSSIGLDPLATLVAIFVGFKLIGFLGFILGPIILVILSTLYKLHILHDLKDYIMGVQPPPPK
ncbi:sporulation integral membrane protein YtvI [Pradoshia sp. D12]|uniref:sporulation integral membrane protein YtvI n=1 Tax=Bacillaceae TaxID=186817 RepID=UPI00112D451C|nr:MULTISPECIES: sporulation integral membrane protein YtvI [Bacillaceae]QFK72488.1 sporulation integral membrane protein YtvI [Pradoshia sp. D12]TPF70768.1 sporulation integral membrane protein YtvI [Bacillus sp. D12]